MSTFGPQSFLTPPISHGYIPAGPHSRFSRLEIEHIAIAYTVLTGAFFAIWWHDALYSGNVYNLQFYETAIAASALTALTGFVAHEMAHKFTAQHRGLWAEFRMSPQGLLFTLIFSVLLGFLFATPGATMIGGRGTVEEAGVTSLAGPAMNMTEAGVITGVFGLLWKVHPSISNTLVAPVLSYVVFLNLVFAVFNLIPWGPLDGAKIWRWSHGIWIGAITAAVAGAVLVWLFFYGVYFLA